VGRCYENGIGVSQDLVEAKEWYSKSKERGYVLADSALRYMESRKKVAELAERAVGTAATLQRTLEGLRRGTK